MTYMRLEKVYHHLPSPLTIAEILKLNNISKEKESEIFNTSDRYSISRNVLKIIFERDNLTKKKVIRKSCGFTEHECLFHVYAIHRANNQINEACNKLWPTLEFMNVVSNKIIESGKYDRLGSRFHRKFTGGSTIPNLYYSHISTLLSIMSIFGCVSVSPKYREFYNLVRTPEGWKLYERKKYLKDICKVDSTSGWHTQVINLYEFMMSKIDEFPKIDIDKTRELQRLRADSQYSVLSDVSVTPAMGLDEIFNFLPYLFNSMAKAFRTIKMCFGVTNSSDNRFLELCEKLPILYDNYNKEFPKHLYDLKI